ncbi:MAG: choice-of-anchor L domain-containing protein [Bacteroidetes bacterium]|nr:choice-of-anchor L domain-containing protein [Bacteroidota bacterium]
MPFAKKYSSLIYKVFFVFLFSFFSSFSQLSITSNAFALNLAQKIVGNGINISNATLNTGGNAAGTFTYNGSNLGLTNGILLTTGLANNAANGGNYFCNINNGNVFSDADLTFISPQGKYDVCILEFDFVPLCDTLKINYVFGSEEYPKAIYNAYNDVFGIFLSGSKPGGGSYASVNIATLPNGITPVSIDSVNAGWPIGTNASHFNYYHDNYSVPNNDIAYNGYTIPISSKAALVSCSKYHLKIAIADGGNGLYDSGVFIQGNSLNCANPPVVTPSAFYSCYNSGTVAVHVTNYAGTPSYTWYPGNQHSDTLKNVVPGTYTCVVDLPGVCGNYALTAFVPTVQVVNVTTGDQLICKGKSLHLLASGANSYTWFPSSGLNNISIANPVASPSVTTTYSVSGTTTGNCTSVDYVTISVSSLTITPDFIASTYQTNIDLSAIHFTASTAGAVLFTWDFGDGTNDSIAQPTHVYNEAGTYEVGLTVYDANQCSETVYKEIIIDDILKDLYTFYIPDAFTPNGDNINEIFKPLGIGWDPAKFKFEIYDRWGRIVFTSNDPDTGWNGLMKGKAKVEPDVYVWHITLKDIYRKEHSYIGHVSLLK